MPSLRSEQRNKSGRDTIPPEAPRPKGFAFQAANGMPAPAFREWHQLRCEGVRIFPIEDGSSGGCGSRARHVQSQASGSRRDRELRSRIAILARADAAAEPAVASRSRRSRVRRSRTTRLAVPWTCLLPNPHWHAQPVVAQAKYASAT